jgi:hypothetical protein
VTPKIGFARNDDRVRRGGAQTHGFGWEFGESARAQLIVFCLRLLLGLRAVLQASKVADQEAKWGRPSRHSPSQVEYRQKDARTLATLDANSYTLEWHSDEMEEERKK